LLSFIKIFYCKYLTSLDENFSDVTEKTKAFYLKTLVESLERKRAFESWKISQNDYEEMFNEIIDNIRKSLLEEKKTQTIVN